VFGKAYDPILGGLLTFEERSGGPRWRHVICQGAGSVGHLGDGASNGLRRIARPFFFDQSPPATRRQREQARDAFPFKRFQVSSGTVPMIDL